MNESLIKYLAGLLDADGSLSFSFKHDQNREGHYFMGLRLSLASSDAVDKNGFTESLPVLTEMGHISRYGEKDQFINWVVSTRSDLEMLLPRLIKHMVIKAKHWQWLLDAWRDFRIDRKTCSLKEREQFTEGSKGSRRSNVGPLKPKNFPTWAWLAGYLDGDGTYHYRSGIYNGYKQWTMNVSAVAHVSDIHVLEFLKESFGGRIQDHGQSKNVFVWMRSLGYQNRDFALRFLPNVAKHSRFKRHKIDEMIHHHRQRLSVPGTEKTFCVVDECTRKVHGNGLCNMHYLRQKRSQKSV